VNKLFETTSQNNPVVSSLHVRSLTTLLEHDRVETLVAIDWEGRA